jgi:uncharacterized protein
MTRIEELERRIRSLESCIVAFSGGVDSSLVAAFAVRALGEQALAVTAVSPALATGELDGARDVARTIGIRHVTITTDELEREGYRQNDRDRCYFCKTELYESLSALAARKGYAAVLSGANADDVGDWLLDCVPRRSTVSCILSSRPASERTRCERSRVSSEFPAQRSPPHRVSRLAFRTAPRWIPRSWPRSTARSSG